MSDVLITGAGGFLGSALAVELARRGTDFRCLGPQRRTGGPFEKRDWMIGSVADAELLREGLKDVSTVFHLASRSTPASASADPWGDMNESVRGIVVLLEECVRADVERVVFSSSGGTVYGDKGDVSLSEDLRPEPRSAYGINKLAVEHYLLLFNYKCGMRNVTLRVGNPYGPFQHGRNNQGIVSLFLQKILAGDEIHVFGDGMLFRDYVYSEDVAGAFVAAADYDGDDEIINIGTGRSRSVIDVIRSIEEETNLSAKIRHMPGRSFDVVHNRLDIGLARRILDWVPTVEWQEGLARTAKWMRDEAV